VIDSTTEDPKPNPTLDEFAADVVAIARAGGDEHQVTDAIAARLKQLLRDGLELTPDQRRPDPDRYVMYPLFVAADGSLCIAAAVWDVGQSTPIHDHGTWGVIGILEGREHEDRYETASEGRPVRLGERVLNAGEVVVWCTHDHDVHAVACASDIPCVGIHVYGANIGELQRRSYDPITGSVRWFVSRWPSAAA
jgi:predicted metal-dependent enzyme (double-stranded beta helix superfamily)